MNPNDLPACVVPTTCAEAVAAFHAMRKAMRTPKEAEALSKAVQLMQSIFPVLEAAREYARAAGVPMRVSGRGLQQEMLRLRAEVDAFYGRGRNA